MGSVVLENVSRRFKDVVAVKDLNLEIRDKEFLVLVGPSGCGKSTTMEMIAGLQAPTEGTIKIGGKVVNDVAPRDRDIAMVFQDYALYPHMSVYENMAFGLKLRKMAQAEIKRRIAEASELLGIAKLLERKPAELSGGQRQRVALGRAITRSPQVFLMDEPLSNLDAKLRATMRAELIKLQRNLAVTTVYVTHDQVEAMTMGDRIAVMKDGWLQQLGTPREVYRKPVNMFVAGFIGTPPMNFLRGTLRRADGLVFDGGSFSVKVPEGAARTMGTYVDKPVVLGIRPENVSEGAGIAAQVDVVEVLGTSTQVTFRAGEHPVVAMLDQDTTLAMGQAVQITFQMEKALFFDPDSEMAIG